MTPGKFAGIYIDKTGAGLGPLLEGSVHLEIGGIDWNRWSQRVKARQKQYLGGRNCESDASTGKGSQNGKSQTSREREKNQEERTILSSAGTRNKSKRTYM